MINLAISGWLSFGISLNNFSHSPALENHDKSFDLVDIAAHSNPLSFSEASQGGRNTPSRQGTSPKLWNFFYIAIQCRILL